MSRKPIKWVTQPEVARMRELARAGWRICAIARDTGRRRETVTRTLRKFETAWTTGDSWSAADLGALERYASDDFPCRAIAVLMYRTHRAVAHKLGRGGCEWIRQRNKDPADLLHTMKLHLRPSTVKALDMVGSEINMKPSDVARTLLRIIERRNLFARLLDLNGDGTNDPVDR